MNDSEPNPPPDESVAKSQPAEEEDEAEAVRLYKLSAEAGDANGQMRYGYCFVEEREGVSTDLVEARKWFNRAAAQGNAEAQWMSKHVAKEILGTDVDAQMLELFDAIDKDGDGIISQAEFHHAMVCSTET